MEVYCDKVCSQVKDYLELCNHSKMVETALGCLYIESAVYARMAKLPVRRLFGGADLPVGRQAR
jgi:hypothetical protein